MFADMETVVKKVNQRKDRAMRSINGLLEVRDCLPTLLPPCCTLFYNWI
jgi:hypothetical protein